MISVCVYASSSDAVDPVYKEDAHALGTLIGSLGWTLVYGAGGVGLMGVTARAVHAAGGKVVGIIPEALMPQVYKQCDELIVTKDLRERKGIMQERANAFVALPGGFGTLEELVEILTLRQLAFHKQAVVLMNTNDFYQPLLAVFEGFYTQHFAKPEYRALVHTAATPDEVIEHIKTYKSVDLPGKWYPKD